MNDNVIAYRNQWTMAFCHPTMSFRRTETNSRTRKPSRSNRVEPFPFVATTFARQMFTLETFTNFCFFFTESLAPSVKTKSNSSDESHARRMRKTTKAGPSGAASRSRLKPLPHRPPPHIPNVSRWMLAGSKQEREPHATCRAQLSTRKKKSPKDCAFRLQWRHSSRFIKSVLFRFQRDFTFKKVLGKEGSRGGFVEKRGFFIPFAS